MAVAWPLVRAHLAALTSLTGYAVFNGPVPTGNAPTHYFTVGDQPSTDEPSAGDFEQGVGPDGFAATETGNVLCELAAATGDVTVPDTFAAFEILATGLQDNQTLDGVLSANATVTASASVVQEQNQAGAVQRLLVSVSYTTFVP